MQGERLYATNMLASGPNGTLPIGVTGDLISRISQHKTGEIEGYTSRYNVRMLVWFEWFGEIDAAIRRENTMKQWRRGWKINLIERDNPHWEDLYPRLVGASRPMF